MIVEVYSPDGQRVASYPIKISDKQKRNITSDQVIQIAQSMAVRDGICSAAEVKSFRFLTLMH